MTNRFKGFHQSISTQLMRSVFALYCVVAIAVTVLQIFAEYKYTEGTVKSELVIVEEVFNSVLSASIWNLDYEQIQNTLQGMQAMPFITGVKVMQANKLIAGIGEIVENDDRLVSYSSDGLVKTDQKLRTDTLISFTFPIKYNFREELREIGTATVYANVSVVFERVKIGIALLVINAVIKTIALWVIFYFISKYMLVRPLKRLLAYIEKTDSNEMTNDALDLQLSEQNEFSLIEQAHHEMMEKLSDARQELISLNNGLEHQVSQRTADLAIAKNEAEQLSKEKINFMSNISHELNTPLSAISAGANILLAHSENWNEEDRYVSKHVVVASQHLSMLVNDIICNLQMKKNDVLIPLEQCSLNNIIESSIAMLAPLAQLHQVVFKYVPAHLMVLSNEGRVRQVLLNIINNAIIFNHPNGYVEIFTVLQEDHRVRLTIEDSGVGMLDTDIPRIFLPFERLDYAKRHCIDGMGIGLSIVADLLKRLNIEYHVTSQLGKGTTFTLIFNRVST